MRKMRTKQNYNRDKSAGFTLIELLVSIGIVAVLAAILFPVFSLAIERQHEATAITNLHEISTKCALFRLDHSGKPPDVLFAYADNGASSMTAVGSMHSGAEKSACLYPAYINDPTVFTDPDDDALVTDPVLADTYKLTDGVLTLSSGTSFFKADAFDISPQVLSQNSISLDTYVPRYQTSWTDVSTVATAPPGGLSVADYNRQLRFLNPPGDTFVTCDTYHVRRAGNVIVLYQSGSVKVLPTNNFLAACPGGVDVAPLTVSTTVPSGNVSNTTFWKLRQ